MMAVMSTSRDRSSPVTITQLPLTRCAICRCTIAYQPGAIAAALTKHYERQHPEELGRR
jgi:hypothetical protein